MITSVYKLSRADLKSLNIRDPYSLHRAVYSLFPKVNGRDRDFLYADLGGDFRFRKILLLSHRQPVVPEFGSLECKAVPDSFLNHDRYGFEVTVNPVKRESATGKTVPIRGNVELLKWFLERSPRFGFHVDVESLTVGHVGVQQFEVNRNDEPKTVVTHGVADFVGKLTVVDRALFRESFAHGISRAKAFGFGLLRIVPLV